MKNDDAISSFFLLILIICVICSGISYCFGKNIHENDNLAKEVCFPQKVKEILDDESGVICVGKDGTLEIKSFLFKVKNSEI